MEANGLVSDLTRMEALRECARQWVVQTRLRALRIVEDFDVFADRLRIHCDLQPAYLPAAQSRFSKQPPDPLHADLHATFIEMLLQPLGPEAFSSSLMCPKYLRFQARLLPRLSDDPRVPGASATSIFVSGFWCRSTPLSFPAFAARPQFVSISIGIDDRREDTSNPAILSVNASLTASRGVPSYSPLVEVDSCTLPSLDFTERWLSFFQQASARRCRDAAAESP